MIAKRIIPIILILVSIALYMQTGLIASVSGQNGNGNGNGNYGSVVSGNTQPNTGTNTADVHVTSNQQPVPPTSETSTQQIPPPPSNDPPALPSNGPHIICTFSCTILIPPDLIVNVPGGKMMFTPIIDKILPGMTITIHVSLKTNCASVEEVQMTFAEGGKNVGFTIVATGNIPSGLPPLVITSNSTNPTISSSNLTNSTNSTISSSNLTNSTNSTMTSGNSTNSSTCNPSSAT